MFKKSFAKYFVQHDANNKYEPHSYDLQYPVYFDLTIPLRRCILPHIHVYRAGGTNIP